MNKFMGMGRITATPELKKTKNDTCYVHFSIAIYRYNGKSKERTADFIPVTAYGTTAEYVAKLFSKGSMIAIEGNIQTGTYEKDGEKHHTWNVNLERFYFTGGKRETANSGEQPAAAQQPAPSYASADNSDFEEIVDDDDLPF